MSSPSSEPFTFTVEEVAKPIDETPGVLLMGPPTDVSGGLAVGHTVSVPRIDRPAAVATCVQFPLIRFRPDRRGWVAVVVQGVEQADVLLGATVRRV